MKSKSDQAQRVSRWKSAWALGIAVMLLVPSLRAQETEVVRQQTASKNAETLVSLFVAIEDVEQRITGKRKELSAASSDEQKKEIGAVLEALKLRLASLRGDFEQLATGVDQEDYDGAGEQVIDLGEEFRELLRPVVGELKAATSKPRELEKMRSAMESLARRKVLAKRAVERLVPLQKSVEEEALEKELKSLQTDWEGRLGEASSQMEGLALRIDERTAEEESIWELVSGTVAKFCTTRGRNLLFALVSFVASFALFRWIYRIVRKHSPLHRKERSSFLVRVLDVAIGALSAVVAVFVAFGVLYASGDWVLLTIGVIFLAGLAWAAKNTLPAVMEQVKLVLNLGPVREGERIVLEGVPWRVDALGFYCEFTNPELTGGLMRLPLRTLIDQHSRPFSQHEQWFPTATNDWVVLGDEIYGKVISQSPEQVVVLKLGGSRMTYSTEAFLGLSPENLSHNFRVRITFGIDYAHQAEVTNSIPAIFQERIEAGLIESAGADGLVSLKVEFKEAGASSLDLEVLADMTGAMGSQYQSLKRRIQQICVDVCNEQKLVIPFTQITVHNAKNFIG